MSFLDNGCIIYKFRPIICVMTGSGGIPSSEAQLDQLNNDEVRGLPVKDISTSMCRRGHNILANRSTFMTKQSIYDMQDIAMHYSSNRGQRIKDFVKSLK